MGTDLGRSTLSPNKLLQACDLAFQVHMLAGAPLAQHTTVLVL